MAPRILIIDHDQVSQRGLAHTLRAHGYEISAASDGSAGIRASTAEHPDLIVVDVVLPSVDGFEFTAKMRAAGGTRHVPILLISPGTELEHRVRALRAGADDFLIRPYRPQELLARARGLLIRYPPPDGSSPAAGEGGRIIAFYGAKGGVGTTTLAINTAIALHRTMIRRVLVMDAKLQFGDLRVFLDVGLHGKTLIDVATAPSIDADLLSKVVIHHESGIDLLLAPPSPESAELVTQEHVTQTLECLRATYDYVVVDTDQRLDEPNLQILDASVAIFVVMTADLPSLKNVRLLMDTLGTLGYERDKVRLVLNRSTAATGINVRNVEMALGRPVNHRIINEYRVAIGALNRGAPFMHTQPDSPLSLAVAEFAAAIDEGQFDFGPMDASTVRFAGARG